MTNDSHITKEYIQIVNLSRIIFVYIIQLLYDRDIRLNKPQILKFLELDSELDSEEPKEVSSKLLRYEYVRSKIDTKSRIGKKLFY
jgi:hypothetical protein